MNRKVESIKDQVGHFSWEMETIRNNQKEMLEVSLHSEEMQETFGLISRFEQPRNQWTFRCQ